MQRLGDGKTLTAHVLAVLVGTPGALRAALGRTWRVIHAALDEDGELGTLAIVSMLLFQLAVGTAGLKLISEHRPDHESASHCVAGSCAVGAVASEPLAATTRPLGRLSPLGILATSPNDEDDPQVTPTAAESIVEGAMERAPSAEGHPTPEPEAQADDEVPLTAVAVAQSLFDELEPPAPTEVFDLPLDPTVRDLPTRRMPYEEFAEHSTDMIERLPSLDVLYAYFPENPMTSDVEEQKQHILHLAEQVEVTVEGYLRLRVDMTRRKAFRDLANYHGRRCSSCTGPASATAAWTTS